jgi:hypothetical protein
MLRGRGMEKIVFRLVWFDSLGAKSTCTLVRTPDVSILIDPGVAVMQPSFPASYAQKRKWADEAWSAIKAVSKEAEVIVISHYHYDHFTDFDEALYRGKVLLAKDPNEYINDSQRRRAEAFYNSLSETFGKIELNKLLRSRERKDYPDPLDDLPLAKSKDYGSYNKRKQELLKKGRKWFNGRVQKWNRMELIPELKFKDCEVKFVDGKELSYGKTKVKFTKPLFHGIEYARVGWVISTTIAYEDEKFIHTSDLEGPVIEDQAEWIMKEDPDVLILDGPSTYLIPFMLNLINLKRAVENMCRIIEETERLKLIIYDHHLPRDRKFKERVRKVYGKAKENDRNVLTAAEYMGKMPAVLKVT